MTPMQQQYNEIKAQYPEDIVLFRLGDFYEAFNRDAETMSSVLGITLTGRGKGANRIPMAGIPHHALDNYLPKLVKSGLKVIMVDQLTDPKPGQLVERGVSKIYTAGTLTEENTLDETLNNHIISIFAAGKELFGAAIADVSTGKLQVFEADIATLVTEVKRLSPSEIILPEGQQRLASILPHGANITYRPALAFEHAAAYEVAIRQFDTTSLKGFGIEDMPLAVSSLGALLVYLQECHLSTLEHIKSTSIYLAQDHMQLDANTIKNLELMYPMSGTDLSATLYHQINKCSTNMGKRKLREWLLYPYTTASPLQERWDAVAHFFEDVIQTGKLRKLLSQVADIERIVGRIGVSSANAKDLWALQESLSQLEYVLALGIQKSKSPRLQHLVANLEASSVVQDVIELIQKSINPDSPAALTEGDIIAGGYNQEIDELRSLRQGGKKNLAEIQKREIERTSIPSLKVSYNKVFGYYIEVTKSHAHKVPTDYIRKQTLSNAERFITQELKDWEDKILSAEEKLIKLEYNLFVEVRNKIAEHARALLHIADVLAELDVLSNFGHIASEYQYCKPELSSEAHTLMIVGGRHPVVEQLQPDFTPNSTSFSPKTYITILTGPNMSGKSTYIRQVALITLLAQIGSFVPADAFKFSPVDRIFTRVGASDNLSQGESTFMVEMNETANILNNATQDSLIILDEVGRGTSTYDGVAIAWAIMEHIATNIKSVTLFATHYHELMNLSNKYPHIRNYHVKVSEEQGRVLFEHKITEGATSKSYGVHVAEMAGVPKDVVKRAYELLKSFEDNSNTVGAGAQKSPRRPKKIHPEQLLIGASLS